MPETRTREAILSRVRETNREVDAAQREAHYQSITRPYQQTPQMEREAILHTFIERLREYDAHVIETPQAAIAETIAQILTANNQKTLAVSATFPADLLPEGFQWHRESDLALEQMNTIQGAVSECEVAIAHTGTIIVKGKRQLTLLPDRYLCVVRADQIVETVPEAITALANIATEPLTFISGPSATADIEMTRIRGVHGPRFLDVVIMRNS